MTLFGFDLSSDEARSGADTAQALLMTLEGGEWTEGSHIIRDLALNDPRQSVYVMLRLVTIAGGLARVIASTRQDATATDVFLDLFLDSGDNPFGQKRGRS